MNRAAVADLYSSPFGTGPRQAIALHCSLAHSGVWRPIGESLTDLLTVRAFDLPSHGRSPDWSGVGDVMDSTVSALLPHLEAPVDLIGHSFGGVVALRLALERPELVRSLSLYEPVLIAVAALDDPEEMRWNNTVMDEVERCVDAGDREIAARNFLRALGDGRRWVDLPEEFRRGAVRRIGFVTASRPAVDRDVGGVVSRLKDIAVPTLVMDGVQSPRLIKVVQDGIAQRMPNAHRVSFDGLTHMGPITHPALIAREIRGFLAEVSA